MEDEQFWADQEASEVIKARGKKKSYVCEAGITPSGPKHIGNFREIITVDMIVRGLRDLGKKVRFQYVWDSYDRFRKVPADVPKEKVEEMRSQIGKPVCDVSDPWGCHQSWAEHWMTKLEEEVAMTGIKPEYVRQHELYRNGFYADEIKKALIKRDVIIKDLNQYRKEPLANDWYPIQVYCEKCGKDSTRVTNYDRDYTINYECKCGWQNKINFKDNGIVKLRWRVDWPMRWAKYDVDFEPAGKDHMVEGSSRTTGELIVKDVYGVDAPYAFMYGLIRSKGGPGKMSASKGNVIFISDALKVYFKPVLRFILMGNRANKDFAISFDEDVLKLYEDFYQAERAYYGKANISQKRVAQLKRVYEYSVPNPSKTMPVQISFRTAALIVQTSKRVNWLKRIKELEKVRKSDESRVKELLECADYWVRTHAPAQHKFIVNKKVPKVKLDLKIKKSLKELGSKLLKKSCSFDELNTLIFELARPVGMREFFTAAYQVIISKKRGPKLAQFIKAIGQEEIGRLLNGL